MTEDEKIVLSLCYDGTLNLQGGRIEKGESEIEALKRELLEEAKVEVLSHEYVGYAKVHTIGQTGLFHNHLIFKAKVNPLPGKIVDPDNIFIDREIIEIEQAYKKLSWGEMGDVILNLAISR